MTLCLLFALFGDVTGEIGSGAGWAGAGLLGLVLGWLLLKHLPEKDAQIERLITRSDERADRLTAEFQESLRMIMDRHDKANVEIIQAMRDEFGRILGSAPQPPSGVHHPLRPIGSHP